MTAQPATIAAAYGWTAQLTRAVNKTSGYYRVWTLLDRLVASLSSRDYTPGQAAAIRGAAWAVETGRLAGSTEMALRAMTARELLATLDRCAAAVRHMGNVPRWLNANIAAQ
jgi:hypothetical protein